MTSVDDLLDKLLKRGFQFSRAPGDDAVPFTLVATFGWSGHIDALHVRSEDDATAWRSEDAATGGIGRVVWSFDGTFEDAVLQLLGLPDPRTRGAPRQPARVSDGVYLPRQYRPPRGGRRLR
ncbi:hypothetical protein [Actinoalloteichus hymeniacidonis]|uniref:Uncharacterized protein n=1 Tax=Actinoalloteichus hymeniacidonis TaxID=340345 RepID=A0AAC9HU78_9PSEU|nr:hypothetical protein [Actinoalloteichus hymeniacidonis]AOS64986.1 hypothetical protein TL08_20975 [Actinoalloteichus hymeniacidonis]MBB5906939.1 hypothetical protein [Actinoalloteichus hymeniacidonis]